MYDFLLVIYANLRPMSLHLQVGQICAFSVEFPLFNILVCGEPLNRQMDRTVLSNIAVNRPMLKIAV